MSIPLIQKVLKEEGLDGWLLYDFHHLNPIFYKITKLSSNRHITRKVFYWIPVSGEPWKIVHKIESHVLDGINGKLICYARREELEAILFQIKGKVAIEYSKEIPYISFVDGGSVDYFRSFKQMELYTSAPILQKLLSLLTKEQIDSHLDAASFLDQVVNEAAIFIKENTPYEKEVSTFIMKRFKEEGFITEHEPIVAAGKNSSNPHYKPKGKGDKIHRGDYFLIDLWCKKDVKNSVYADITRVFMLGEPSKKMKEAFKVVREAQKIGVQNIKIGARGADIDTQVRNYLENCGYGEFILHRLGHSIDTDLHGSGANLDSFESFDTRKLIPFSCYSVEPALYFPGEFGIRLEHNVILTDDAVVVTGGVQDEINSL